MKRTGMAETFISYTETLGKNVEDNLWHRIDTLMYEDYSYDLPKTLRITVDNLNVSTINYKALDELLRDSIPHIEGVSVAPLGLSRTLITLDMHDWTQHEDEDDGPKPVNKKRIIVPSFGLGLALGIALGSFCALVYLAR